MPARKFHSQNSSAARAQLEHADVDRISDQNASRTDRICDFAQDGLRYGATKMEKMAENDEELLAYYKEAQGCNMLLQAKKTYGQLRHASEAYFSPKRRISIDCTNTVEARDLR